MALTFKLWIAISDLYSPICLSYSCSARLSASCNGSNSKLSTEVLRSPDSAITPIASDTGLTTPFGIRTCIRSCIEADKAVMMPDTMIG